MKIGITGTRQGLSADQKDALVKELRSLDITEFHHGACVGVDLQAAELVENMKSHRTAPPPVIAHPGSPGSYFERNREIVDAVDLLLVCPRGLYEDRGGTWYTYNYAIRVGKPVRVVWPNGTVTTPENTR